MLTAATWAPDWLQAIVLGIVQGATEFIPVSSSGHLVITPYVMGWDPSGLAFDVALHMGTVGAILVYFRRELLAMAHAVVRPNATPDGPVHRRLALLLVIASLPVAVAGLLLKDLVEGAFESPRFSAVMLLATATLLVGGERLRVRRIARTTGEPIPGSGESGEQGERLARSGLPVGEDGDDPHGATLETMTLRQALIVGGCQALSLMPGLSRSGTTITAGLAAGLTRPAAARFSFLMALPALLGAGLVSLPELSEPGPYSGAVIAAGVVAAFISGYAAIAFLVKLVSRTGLHVFSIYLVLLSAATLALTFFRPY